MELRFHNNAQEIALQVTPDGTGWRVRLPDGGERAIRVERLGDALLVHAAARVLRVPFCRMGDTVEISWRGRTYRFAEGGLRGGEGSSIRASGLLESPMTGVVAQTHAGVGDPVAAYQPLLTVEAMKVLVTIEAPFEGVLSALRVGKGDRVETGDVVAEVTPADKAGI